jgi:hypothetical protein
MKELDKKKFFKKIKSFLAAYTHARTRAHTHTHTHPHSVQLKSGLYFNMSNLFTKIYNMLYYTTNLYLQ